MVWHILQRILWTLNATPFCNEHGPKYMDVHYLFGAECMKCRRASD